MRCRGEATATVCKPNITVFDVRGDGTLKHVSGSTVDFPLGLSPTQVLASPDGKFVFADNFAIPGTTPAQGNTLDAFKLTGQGKLELVSGGVATANVAAPTLIGISVNPKQRIVYGGLVAGSQIAVFTYDKKGALTFVRAVADQGAGPCWTAVSADGKYLYAVNTGSVSVAVYSLKNPLNPVQIQDFALKLPTPPAGQTKAPVGAFEFSLDPSGDVLDVLTTQSTDAALSVSRRGERAAFAVGCFGWDVERAGKCGDVFDDAGAGDGADSGRRDRGERALNIDGHNDHDDDHCHRRNWWN